MVLYVRFGEYALPKRARRIHIGGSHRFAAGNIAFNMLMRGKGRKRKRAKAALLTDRRSGWGRLLCKKSAYFL